MVGSGCGRGPRSSSSWGIRRRTALRRETLAEEIADQSGLKLDILGMKAAGKAEGGAIVLARLQDSAGAAVPGEERAQGRQRGGRRWIFAVLRQDAFDSGGQDRAGIVLWRADVAAVAAAGGQGPGVSGGGDSRLAQPGRSHTGRYEPRCAASGVAVDAGAAGVGLCCRFSGSCGRRFLRASGRFHSVENPHPSASLRAGFLAQRTREKWGTRP